MENEVHVAAEDAKKVVNYFCGCIKFEMDKHHTGDMRDTLIIMAEKLYTCSAENAGKLSIKAIERQTFTMFEPFANKRTRIPYHIWQWLYLCYMNLVDFDENHRHKPLDVYEMLRRDFIEYNRCDKEIDREEAQYYKEQRHKLRRIARDGKYNYTISLRDKSLSDIFTKEEFDEAYVIFDNMFYKQLDGYPDVYRAYTAAFLLGVRQGIDTCYRVVKAAYDADRNSETFTNSKKIIHRKTCQ